MKTKSNPVVPRMAHVAKHFNDFVTLATFYGWAEANGLHTFRSQLIGNFLEWPHDPSAPPEWRREHFFGAGRMLARRVAACWSTLPASSPADRYLPWLAREVNKLYKAYYQRYLAWDFPPFPPMYPDLSAVFGRPQIAMDFPFESRRDMTALASHTQELVEAFGNIVKWATATGVDINAYDAPAAISAAGAWLESQRSGVPEQGPIAYQFADGWTVQDLGCAGELRDEAEAMGHCVDTYINDVYSGDTKIFSLRDPSGRPHVTMEWLVHDRHVGQMRGKQNVFPPKKEYVLRMIEFRDAALEGAQPARVAAESEDEMIAAAAILFIEFVDPSTQVRRNPRCASQRDVKRKLLR
jgi:hypothetical protein